MIYDEKIIKYDSPTILFDDNGKFVESVSSESISDFGKSHLFNND